jgi:hypothetical protein
MVYIPLGCQDSSVGIATELWAGSNPGGGKIFCAVQTGPEAHPAFCIMGLSWE